ncbi:threonylcarbamoyl-AMP synthase [Paroceanicella profunda]|uniref:Threonylcarbamoyl-AMP synthase n=1 Tax=Paroceanicella profunda TaxID=2579971 RepID=A0A5B8FHG2_9RHOB|nr:L-threonylcarbamoyladenylate synthase [Paroceanicella profunda]QDL91968.1 threonylcarbamoyl-AMP synthase [Paroceanicella profunda]
MTSTAEGETERLAADSAGIARAAALLRAGALVSFATETVYGLGADASDDHAVAAIYAAKARPQFNPLIVHFPDRGAAETIAEFPPLARLLAERFWPGPLTLVLPRRAGAPLSELVTAGLPSVAVRVPAHPLARRLLSETGRGIAAPSANPSGRISPTTAGHVLDGLGGRIAAVLDGGPCPVGVESTIVDVSDPGRPAVILREGGLAREEIAAVLAAAGAPALGVGGRESAGAPVAPGQLASHYAPAASLRLDAAAPEAGEAWLGFGPDPVLPAGPALNLSPRGDLTEAAANLFSHMRRLDAAAGPQGRIAAAPVPETGLGRAINDRLRRAAAPREG